MKAEKMTKPVADFSRQVATHCISPGWEQNMPPEALDGGETALLGPVFLGPVLRTYLQPNSGQGKSSRLTLFPAVRISPIQNTLLSLRLHQGCFQLIMGLYNYGDYSLWLFSSPHLLLSNTLRLLIKHGDPGKVSKVLIRHFLKLKKTQSLLLLYFLKHSFKTLSGTTGAGM